MSLTDLIAGFALYGTGLGMLVGLVRYARTLKIDRVTVKTASSTFTYVRHTPSGSPPP